MREKSSNYNDEYLIEIVASVVSQREAFLKSVRPSWERIYKMSDYHHVSNIVYYKIMWTEDNRLKRLKAKFENRYKYSVQQQERYMQIRQQLENELENKRIDCLFLGEALYIPYYTHTEMRMPQPIQVLVSKNRMDVISEIMYDMGFVEDLESEEVSECKKYKKTADLKIEFYEELKFTKPKVSKFFRSILVCLPRKENRQRVKYLNADLTYMYTICTIAEKYSHGQIEIRDIVDLWMFLSNERENIRWRKVDVELNNLRLKKFERYIIKLALRWFNRDDFLDDDYILDDMQAYIIYKGEKSRKENERILPLTKRLVDMCRKEFVDDKRYDLKIDNN